MLVYAAPIRFNYISKLAKKHCDLRLCSTRHVSPAICPFLPFPTHSHLQIHIANRISFISYSQVHSLQTPSHTQCSTPPTNRGPVVVFILALTFPRRLRLAAVRHYHFPSPPAPFFLALLVLLLNIYCLLKGDEAEAGCEVGGDCRRGMYKALVGSGWEEDCF